ncbi:hypothetical protein [Fusibacter ferrireducens]|uniref:DUF5655 domain-containing protein n=1 Tax=Fusibacter ferrireducens TaxID=2785058 RepID=A0ABS0A042_9FIRM|nr:hypothetical protein [Fusibacter ferrireducens]MBF4696074.1 hypothetical protein [Fusibacter ferrireducens]
MKDFIDFKKVSLKNHKDINESTIQKIIAGDPKILGLGELILKDIERVQSNAGRLDLLLQDLETYKRYEVEIQLGKLDESHIIRTIEYWDIERRKYPQYDHCAVIIAEDITSRFLNILQLFNGHIPIIGIQMNAYEVDGKLGLIFTKVIDEMTLGLIDDDENTFESASREYWEEIGTKETVAVVDELLNIIQLEYQDVKLKYNKAYIGLTENGVPKNFIVFRVKKKHIRMEIRLQRTDEIDDLINESELDLMEYDNRDRRYRIRLSSKELQDNYDLIKILINKSYQSW